jgi:hypothetical protein
MTGLLVSDTVTVTFTDTYQGTLNGNTFTATSGSFNIDTCKGSVYCGITSSGPFAYDQGVSGSMTLDGAGGISGNISGVFSMSGSTNTVNEAAPVPLPAAAWLLGSGLLGLIRTARRRGIAA